MTDPAGHLDDSALFQDADVTLTVTGTSTGSHTRSSAPGTTW